MIADDLFAGAGGWDLAAEALGIHARGVENMPAARATRDAAGLTTIHDDVWTFAPDGQASGLIASPPCQTFSAAGKGTGRKALDDVLAAIRRRDWRRLDLLKAVGEKAGDDRTALVLTPLHFAMTNPGYQWLAWEQVPTVLPVWEACADTLRAYGWSAWTGLLHSETFGVPQTRKRAFLLASRHGVVTPPVATHSRYHNRTPEKLDEGVQKWVSMAEALGWGMVARPSMTVTSGSAHAGNGSEWGGGGARRGMLRAQIEGQWVLRNNNTANAAVRRMDQPAPTLYFGQRCNYVAWEPTPAIEGETETDRPATTVQGDPRLAAPGHRCMTVDCHPGQAPVSMFAKSGSVRVTVEEAGVLQSFPADFPWQGTKGKQYLQAGNAVPPLMAVHALAAATGLATETREQDVSIDDFDVEHIGRTDGSCVISLNGQGPPPLQGARRMNLIAPRKSLYWTHRRAINEATAIAHNTGVRQRVELADPTRHGTARFRIVPVTPPVEGAVA